MPIFSNIDQVGAWLERCVEDINFNLPGINESLGYDCAVAVAEGIQERSLVDQRGATKPFRENSPGYLAYKIKYYLSNKINIRTAQMLSMSSLSADITIRDGGETVVMCYGTGEPPRSGTYAGTGHMERSDMEITDKEKASIAHNDGRAFFEIDQDIANERVLPILKEALGHFLQERANG